jgi:hypothetical protein
MTTPPLRQVLALFGGLRLGPNHDAEIPLLGLENQEDRLPLHPQFKQR